MKVVVFDDGGLMGVETALWIQDHGHEVDLVSAPVGVDSLTHNATADVLRSCAVVVDLVDPLPSVTGTLTEEIGPVEDEADLTGSRLGATGQLLRAGLAAGVKHHVCLSTVGADRVRNEGEFRALQAREAMIRRSGATYSILRATQMFEAAEGIARASTADGIVRVPPVEVRPVALTEVAMLLAHTAVSRPLNGVREIAGPEQFGLDAFVRTAPTTRTEHQRVRTDARTPFFGTRLRPLDLLPSADAFVAHTSYREWFASRPTPEITS
ncbi:hypothetical protein [Streptomyces sp. TLI_185]|uniref:hypothetical protein n=1 Tax=Streptomyces sp. TLI_185 TaxID=2485151 RepID=UPI000F50CAD0|nr:hypothetical protein [Streptomyces sp. TLI_185]RPF30434.1 uncharacterized protein YbjT (DUF2867 family) [Streptomyces sp. TLI_185]